MTETALTTALNTAYFAESMATFVIAMGFALLLTGIGFLVLSLRVLRQPSPAPSRSSVPTCSRPRLSRPRTELSTSRP